MVVCKFFQQGNCRYGQSCRFDHIYGSKYSYHAQPPQQPAQSTPANVTGDQLINQVQLDVQAVLKGGQWILSCYSPYKEKPNFPGITDLSMEEARLFIYEAKASNNLDQAVSHMNNLFKDYAYKYEQLLQAAHTPAIVKVLKSLYKGEIVPSPFTSNNNFGSDSAATSVFRSAVQGSSVFGQCSSSTCNPSVFGQSPTNTTPSIFGQQNATNTSVFGQPAGFGQSNNQTPSVFGQANNENAKSIFAQASQNVFGPSQPTNVFAPTSPDATAKSIFAQATQNAFSANQTSNPGSLFGEASQSVFGKSSDPFNQQKDQFSQQNDPFNQQKDPFSQSKDPFSQPSGLFNQQNNPFAPASTQNVFQVTDQQAADNSIYSDMNELTPECVEAFKAEDFKLGFIPELPPPYSLCF